MNIKPTDGAKGHVSKGTEQTSEPTQRHYSPREIAELWCLSDDAVRDMFRDEPGVLKFGNSVSRPGKKRAYTTIRIPESVLKRVYNRMVL